MTQPAKAPAPSEAKGVERGRGDITPSWLLNRRASLILAAMLLLIVASPIGDYWAAGQLLLAPTVVLVVLAMLRHGQADRWLFRLALALAVAWVVTVAVSHVLHLGALLSNIVMLSINLLTLVVMLRHVVQADQPNWETLSAAFSGYLLIAAIWAEFYVILLSIDPGSFPARNLGRNNASTLLYFSLQSLTTMGFGDVTPVNPFARMLATVEAALGQFYIATVVARLATLTSHRRS